VHPCGEGKKGLSPRAADGKRQASGGINKNRELKVPLFLLEKQKAIKREDTSNRLKVPIESPHGQFARNEAVNAPYGRLGAPEPPLTRSEGGESQGEET